MKKITSISILGYKIPIIYTNLPQTEEFETAACYDGVSNIIQVDIKVWKKSTDIDRMTNLLHEAMHAVLDITGWSRKLPDVEEEHLVTALANALAPLLKFKG